MKKKRILTIGTLAALVLNITVPVYSSEIKTAIPIIKNEMEITASYTSTNEEKITILLNDQKGEPYAIVEFE